MSTKRTRKSSRPNKRDMLRHRLFSEAYLAIGQKTYLNAEQSAKVAGYSPATCRGGAYRLLATVGIQNEMRRLRDERAKLSTIAGPVEVLETLTAQMRMLPNKLMTNGELIPLDEMTVEQAHAIAGAKTSTKTIQAGDDTITETRIEYKLVDRTRAAVELARHHGLFERDNEQQKPDVPQPLVLMTAKPLTLAEWTEQAQAIMAKAKKEPAQPAT